MPQREIFLLNLPNVIRHNIALLTNYYTKKKYTYYKELINAHFIPNQNRDTRYIPTPLIIPLSHISTNECNPKNDIRTNTYTIQTQNDVTHIYEETGRHLITIPNDRLD